MRLTELLEQLDKQTIGLILEYIQEEHSDIYETSVFEALDNETIELSNEQITNQIALYSEQETKDLTQHLIHNYPQTSVTILQELLYFQNKGQLS